MAKPTKQDVVNELYIKKYKPFKFAPVHVTNLKKVMLTAAKKKGAGKKEINAAAKAFMKEKGLPSQSCKKSKVESPKKGKKVSTKKEPTVTKEEQKGESKKKSKREASVEELRKDHNLSQMGEDALKDLAKERGVKVKNKHTADDIRKNVNKDLIGLQKGTPEALAGVDLTQIKDCVGLFIDFRDVSCVKCTTQEDCLKKFSKHQADGFKAFSGIRIEVEVQEQAAKVDAKDVPKEEKKKPKAKKKGKKKKSSGYDLDRKIDVYDEFLDNKDDLYSVAKIVKKRVPATIGALQTIILSAYDPEEDTDESRAQLTKEFIDVFVEWDLIELL